MYNNKHLIKRYGKSYYLATLFFPAHVSKDTMELYKFVRIPDQIVDGEVQDANQLPIASNLEEHYSSAHAKLIKMRQERKLAYEEKNKRHVLRGDSVELFNRKEIPFEYSKAFFEAMLKDTTNHRYQTYEQLKDYMYGSASVVWLMMCHLIWCDRRALDYADLLWEAMQLSNFLRDIREDYESLWRIYIPEEDLKHYSLSHEDLIGFSKERRIDDNFTSFMKAYIAMNREQYRKSLEWVKYLHPRGRRAVYLAAKLYEGILDRIEANDYNVFGHSCRTTKRDKAKLLTKGLIDYIYH